jgi:hypothetical protein
MNRNFSGNIALVCPDCANRLVNVASHGERYHCLDCDLRLLREREQFLLIRDGEAIGRLSAQDVGMQVIWRHDALAPVG